MNVIPMNAADSLRPPTVQRDRRWWILACLCLSLLLITANVSSLNVNLPVLQRSLGSSNSGLQWIVDAYSLMFAGLLLPAGALADRYGRKIALQFGLVVFGTASVLAMAVSTTWQVIACRGVMGVGAAFIMPGTLSILTNVFDAQERGRAIAIWAAFAGLGGVLGPITSGYLLDHYYWGSAFAINIVIVVIALISGALLLPNSRQDEVTALDPVGVALVVSGLIVFLYGVIEGPDKGWLAPLILASLAIGALLLAAFVRWELANPAPMLDMRLFRNRSFAVGSGTIVVQYFALFGCLFIFAQYLQLVKGFSPLQAATAMLPMGMLVMVGAPMSHRMVARYGPRVVVATGLLLTATGMGVLSFARPNTSLVVIIVGVACIGLGIGQTTAPSTTLIMNAVRDSHAGVGSAVNDVSRELGGALGIAVLGSILNSLYRSHIDAHLPAGLSGPLAASAHRSVSSVLLEIANPHNRIAPALGGQVVAGVRIAFADAFGFAMITGAIALFVCAALVLRFQARGAEVNQVQSNANYDYQTEVA
jgi:EmrB/QacA subfamily drug resistance transporter